MLYLIKFHALMALASLLVVWLRAALSFQGKVELANHKLALVASAGTMGLLLLSAVAVMIGAGQYPFVDAWLTEKLVWLGGYILFAVMALVPKVPMGFRAISLSLASIAFAFAFAVAKHHVGIVML